MADNRHEGGRGGQPVTGQPTAQPPMNEQDRLARLASEKYVENVAEGAADKTVEYATDDPQQKMDDAKEQAKGMWTKYCGCLGSA